MTTAKRNGFTLMRRALAGNMLSAVWSAAVALLAVPLYVRYLGLEAYGLIGLFTTLQVSIALLDLGLSSTMTRELARRTARGAPLQEIADVLRTFETIFFAMAVVIVIVLLGLSGPLARDWVKAQTLDTKTVQHAFRYMGLAIAAQWPGSVYVGALLGLERQVTQSSVSAFFATTRAIGILFVFCFIKPSVESFFIWQTINSAAQVVVMGVLVWRLLPGTFARARFRRDELKSVWRFALGNMAIDGTGIVLSQIDKVVLSKFLSLEAFGIYSLVSTIATNTSRIVGPIYTVYYPRLAKVVSGTDRDEIRRTYQDGAQILAICVVPVCVVLAVYSREVLTVWTGDRAIAAAAALILTVLTIGRLANAIVHIPVALQLANGWTSLSFYSNVISIIVVVPLVFVGVRWLGVLGAALAWLLLTVGTLCGIVPIMHRRMLPGEMGPWLKGAIVLPLVGTLGAALPMRLFIDSGGSRLALLVELGMTTALAFIGCLVATPNSRRWLLARLRA